MRVTVGMMTGFSVAAGVLEHDLSSASPAGFAGQNKVDTDFQT